jgi:hypothetical protein
MRQLRAIWLGGALIALLVAGRAHAYSNDPQELALRQATATGVAQVQVDPGGGAVPSEKAFWVATFLSFENPQIALPDAGPLGTALGDLMWDCYQHDPMLEQARATLGGADLAALRHLIQLYGGQVMLASPFTYDTTAWASCVPGDVATMPGFVSQTRLGQLFRTELAPGDRVAAVLVDLRTTRGAQVADLVLLHMLRRFPDAFGLDDATLRARCGATQFCSADEVFEQKVTPSLGSNNAAAGVIAQPLGWDQLGMNAYWADGDSPIKGWLGRRYAWVGKQIYEHPILTNLIPVIGPCIEAADAFESLREGLDASGQPQPRLFSAAVFTTNFVFAAADVPMVRSGAVASWRQLRDLAARARGANTAADVLDLPQQAAAVAKAIEVNGVQAGAEAVREANSMGSAVDELSALAVPILKLRNDAEYERLFHPAIIAAASMAKQERPLTEIMDRLANSSRSTMQALRHPDFDDFGRLNLQDRVLMTPVKGSCAQPELWNEVANWVDKSPTPAWDGGAVPPSANYRQIIGTIDGQPIPLSLIYRYEITSPDGVKGMILHWYTEFGDRTSILSQVNTHCESLYRQLLASTNREEIIDLVAEIHWWYATMTPYKRGTNGISHALAVSLLKAKGIRAGHVLDTVSLDFKAFARSIDEYKRDYRTFFTRLEDVPPPRSPDVMPSPPPAVPPNDFPAPLSPPFAQEGIEFEASLSQGAGRRLVGWIADRNVLAAGPSDDAAEDFTADEAAGLLAPLDHYRVLVRQVAGDGTETQVDSFLAGDPSPADMDPTYLKDLNKTTAGFTYPIPDGLSSARLRFYAHHPILAKPELLIYDLIPGSAPPCPVPFETRCSSDGLRVETRYCQNGLWSDWGGWWRFDPGYVREPIDCSVLPVRIGLVTTTAPGHCVLQQYQSLFLVGTSDTTCHSNSNAAPGSLVANILSRSWASCRLDSDPTDGRGNRVNPYLGNVIPTKDMEPPWGFGGAVDYNPSMGGGYYMPNCDAP